MKLFRYFFILLILLSTGAYAQNKLPACKGANAISWTNCYGFESNLPACEGLRFFKKWSNCLGESDGYIGEWQDDKPNGWGWRFYRIDSGGYGKRSDDEWYSYIGQWTDGKKSGLGRIKWSNGTIYVGEFSNDWINGWGYMTGHGAESFWIDGQPQRNRKGERGNRVDQLFNSIALKKEEEKQIKELETIRLNYAKTLLEFKNFKWEQRASKAIHKIIQSWYQKQYGAIDSEVMPPIFPPSLKLSQEKWESNQEFEDRVERVRTVRQKEIEQIQSEYKIKVNKRNADIRKLVEDTANFKNDTISKILSVIDIQIAPKNATFDPDRGLLYVDASIDGGKVERYEYQNVPIQVRREAVTSVASLKMTPEFFITESGQFGIKTVNIESDGFKAVGTLTQTGAGNQPLRLASIDVPIDSMSALTQQSAVTVDRNQVEQILYRSENESLRKRLEEQRNAQELTLAEEARKASAESSRLKSESDALRQRQRELELQLASTSRTPINYGRVLNAHALVIGNASYGGSAKLPNPINDAKAISGVLRGLGFTVTESLDADRTKLVTALSQFSRSATNADITLLFYAGHGVQISGTNYMLPIDLNLNDLSQVPLQGVSLNSVVEQYLPGKTKLVFLDACRDNPLMQTASRSVSRGLAPINVSEGTLISYSTKDGQVAQDGDGKNSPFTTALMQHLGDPDDIAVVLRKVREMVLKNTGGKQQPWEYGSLTGGALVLSAIKPIK